MFKLHINTSNAAFDDDELAAIADILEEVKLKLLNGAYPTTVATWGDSKRVCKANSSIQDTNGNTIGYWVCNDSDTQAKPGSANWH